MNRFHIESMAEDERDAEIPAQIGDQIPAEHAFDCDGEILLSIWFENRGENLRRSVVILVDQHGTQSIGDVKVHGSCVQIDPAMELMAICVEAHQASSLGG